MVKTMIKVLLISGLGISILTLIPTLFLPIASVIDFLIDSNFTSFMTTVYATIPLDLMNIVLLQLSTIVIIIILRFIFGSRK
jgi:hypothetical protein